MHFPLLLLLCFISLTMAQDVLDGVIIRCDSAQPGEQRKFALTFDDGPSDYTLQLLDILDAEKVQVTFFVQGNNAENVTLQPALKQAYLRGHQIGSHTYDHPSLKNITLDEVRMQMNRTQQIISDAIGVRPRFMRPPFGDLTLEVRDLLQKEYGFSIVDWNIDSDDWVYEPDPSLYPKVTENFKIALAKPEFSTAQNATAISLQHDTLIYSIQQTRDIIRMIRAAGYAFSTVADCLNPKLPYYLNGPNNVFGPGSLTNKIARISDTNNNGTSAKKSAATGLDIGRYGIAGIVATLVATFLV